MPESKMIGQIVEATAKRYENSPRYLVRVTETDSHGLYGPYKLVSTIPEGETRRKKSEYVDKIISSGLFETSEYTFRILRRKTL